jgi:hypothetical protein
MDVYLVSALCLLFFAGYAAVAMMRWSLGRREDDHLHYSDREQPLIAAQAAMARKLDVLDRWKSLLLAGTILVGLAAIALHMYNMWSKGPGVQ